MARSPRARAAFLPLLLGQVSLLCHQEQVVTLQRSCQDVPWILKSHFVFEAHAGHNTTASLHLDVRKPDTDLRIVVGALNS
jgi:hypothetical protein